MTVDLAQTKDTNPKEAFGDSKIPFHLIPGTSLIALAIGLLDGALKYGRSNYRPMGVKASTYVAACFRHILAWMEGEDDAPDSGIPHLFHAISCLAILIDAIAQGNLVDDRNYPGGYIKMLNESTRHVDRLKGLYKDRSPYHYALNAQGKYPVDTDLGGVDTHLEVLEELRRRGISPSEVLHPSTPRRPGLLRRLWYAIW